MRSEQEEGTRGSLKWVQRLLDRHPALLSDALLKSGGIGAEETIDWVSPRRDDGWAEYRDAKFLERIGHPELGAELQAFWPRRGPQWDALGRGSNGTVVLVEAKAHIGELSSTCEASPDSRGIIERALTTTKEKLGINSESDWTTGYYQYANRLAHAQFLRDHGIPTTLVFLYFINADMGGPNTEAEWKEALKPVHRHLGLKASGHPLGVMNIFIDSRQLQ